MTLTVEEAVLFLSHLGDGTLSLEIEPETVTKVNKIQRAAGIHGDCLPDWVNTDDTETIIVLAKRGEL